MRRKIDIKNISQPRTCPICRTPNSLADKGSKWQCNEIDCSHIEVKVDINQIDIRPRILGIKAKNFWKIFAGSSAALLLVVASFIFVINNRYASHVTLLHDSQLNVLFVNGFSERIWWQRNTPLFDRDNFVFGTTENSIISVNPSDTYANYYISGNAEGRARIFVSSEHTNINDSEYWHVFRWNPLDNITNLNRGTSIDLFNQLSPQLVEELNHQHSIDFRDHIHSFVTFSSSDSSVLTVDGQGAVVAVSRGSATVAVRQGNTLLQNYDFVVLANIEDVLLQWNPLNNSGNLNRGASFDLLGQLSPQLIEEVNLGRMINLRDYVHNYVNFSSSNSAVLDVDRYGVVTAVGRGDATITVRHGGVTLQSYDFSVRVAVEDIRVSSSRVTLEMGAVYQLQVTVIPSDADATVTFRGSGVDVTAGGLIQAPAWRNATYNGNHNVTVTAGGLSRNVAVNVRNSHTWGWRDENWRVDDVPTSTMVFANPIPNSLGFRVGINLIHGGLGNWGVYVWSGGNTPVTSANRVGQIRVTELGVWTEVDISFSSRNVNWILIRPPVDVNGGWSGWSMYGRVSRLNYNGRVH